MGYKLKPTKKSSNKKYSFTTTSDGKRICQTARAKEVWIDATRKKLYRERSKEERKVYEWLPPVLKRQAELQFVIEYQSHVYFADIYLKRLKVAIEVDGEFHYSEDQKAKDKIRETHFAKKGITTMRIRNADVNSNARLWAFIQSLMLSPSRAPRKCGQSTTSLYMTTGTRPNVENKLNKMLSKIFVNLK